jgi:hypothetical protein
MPPQLCSYPIKLPPLATPLLFCSNSSQHVSWFALAWDLLAVTTACANVDATHIFPFRPHFPTLWTASCQQLDGLGGSRCKGKSCEWPVRRKCLTSVQIPTTPQDNRFCHTAVMYTFRCIKKQDSVSSFQCPLSLSPFCTSDILLPGLNLCFPLHLDLIYWALVT